MSYKKGKSVVPSKNASVNGGNKNVAGVVEETEVVASYEGYCGPIPPPNELEEYERVYPGAAREIFDMAKVEQKMRLDIIAATREENMTNCKIKSTGQFLAFLVFVGIIGACFYAIYSRMGNVAVGLVAAIAAGYGIRVFALKS